VHPLQIPRIHETSNQPQVTGFNIKTKKIHGKSMELKNMYIPTISKWFVTDLNMFEKV